jgi:heme-degrading monooxygenase HmoA
MFVVIFRATVGRRDAEYAATAAHLRNLTLQPYGWLDFAACEEAGQEVAVSYWPDPQRILAWREDPAHRAAQRRGLEHWYNGHCAGVAEILRSYAEAGHGGDS